MADHEPFHIDPDDVDRMLRAAGDQLRDTLGAVGRRFGPSGLFENPRERQSEPKTAGQGVWVISAAGADGSAQVEQVFATELDALRANQHNLDGQRRVQFLPYGIAVSALDATDESTS